MRRLQKRLSTPGDVDISALARAVASSTGRDAFRPALDGAQWQQFAAALSRRAVAPGELLIRRGDNDRCAYLVEAGELQVFVTGGPPRSHRIATLCAGALVGEPGLFVEVPRMAHVEAMTACAVWQLQAGRLQALALVAPALALEVLRAAGAVMAARLTNNLERGIPVS